MKRMRVTMPLVAVLCGSLIMTACGAGGTTTGTSGNTSKVTTTTASTATPKPKPSTVPQITLPFCQSVLTVAEANQIMQPATPATRIAVSTQTDQGACHYLPAQGSYSVVSIFFSAYSGPNPIPMSVLTENATEAAANLGADGGSITTATTVSGVGDQAAFVAMNAKANGVTVKADVFFVLYGTVLSNCYVISLGSLPPDATEQARLQQCAQHVVSAL